MLHFQTKLLVTSTLEVSEPRIDAPKPRVYSPQYEANGYNTQCSRLIKRGSSNNKPESNPKTLGNRLNVQEKRPNTQC